MTDWLRNLLMIFYAPLRGMREVRDRGSLAPAAFVAFIGEAAYTFVTDKFFGAGGFIASGRPLSALFHAAVTVVVVAIVLVPILTLVANTIERRGSFRVVITQEYAPVAATMFYALTVVNVFCVLAALVVHYSGLQGPLTTAMATQLQLMMREIPQGQFNIPAASAHLPFTGLKVILFLFGTVFGVRDVFRTSIGRAFFVSLFTFMAAIFIAPIAVALFSGVLGSPFLLILLFILLRGYFVDIMGTHRAKAAFKQNLESATLNPADASAHYNLGLIHQSRGELDAARERFERALQIDEGEIDASYQLGRIARQQKRYADAISNFEHVVVRDPAHSLHEIWREVAATYIGAGQFEDARNALEQFLEHRPSDPEGLYLMGRAHAGLGHKREATNLMQACIDAVKTAPAYKYRASKRWLNEAQQFIKGSQ